MLSILSITGPLIHAMKEDDNNNYREREKKEYAYNNYCKQVNLIYMTY